MFLIIFVALTIGMVAAENMDPACATPPNATFTDCCQMKLEFVPKSVFEGCASSIPKVTPPPPPGPGPAPPLDVMCSIECALKQAKVFVDGKIDKNVVVTLMTSKDASLKPAVESAVDFCLNKISKMTPPPTPAPLPCSPIPMIATGCVYGQLYQNCTSLVNSDNCKKLSEFNTKCGWVPPCNKDH